MGTSTQTKTELTLDDILAGAQLPALPQSAIRLLELSQDPSNGPAEFAVPIESDPGLAGQVLRFVNSSYFGFSREVSSVKLAITLVGIRTIKNFTLWSAVFSLMPNPQCGPFDLKKLWQDSLRRGLFARGFGKLMGLKDAEEAFAAALLQDMAVPLLAKELPGDYLELLQSRQDGKGRLSEFEMTRFGWTHADAGAQMAKTWNLPPEFVDLIHSHTRLDELLPERAERPQELAVALSSLLPSAQDSEWREYEKFEQSFKAAAEGGVGPEELLAQIDQQFAEFAPVLKIASPSKSLEDWYRERKSA